MTSRSRKDSAVVLFLEAEISRETHLPPAMGEREKPPSLEL
jgi:hypothetical protein